MHRLSQELFPVMVLLLTLSLVPVPAHASSSLLASVFCGVTSWFGIVPSSCLPEVVPTPPARPPVTQTTPHQPSTPVVISTGGVNSTPANTLKTVYVTEYRTVPSPLTTASYVTKDDLATGLLLIRTETNDSLNALEARLRSIPAQSSHYEGGSTNTTGTFTTLSSDLLSAGRLSITGTATSTLSGDVAFDSSTLYIDSINHRVGIGTTSPSQPLAVQGNALISGNLSVASITATSTLTASATTTAPYFTASSLGSVASPAFTFTNNTNTGLWSSGSNILNLSTNGAERVRITGAGNVGIGTTNPQSVLSIEGDGTASKTLAMYNSNTTNLRYNEIKAQASPTDASFGAGIRFLKDATGANYGSTIQFLTETDNGASDDYAARMVIRGGNVGIGTTGPVAKLDVNGGVNLGDSQNLTWGGVYGAGIPTMVSVGGGGAYMAFYPAGSTSGEQVRITGAGNVGIGTTNPQTTLDIRKAGAVVEIYNTTNAGTATFYLASNQTGGTSKYFAFNHTANDATNGALYIIPNSVTNSAAAVTIQSTGNVGIGTTSPWRTFSTVGTVGLSSTLASSGPSSNTLCIDTTTYEVFRISGACTGSSIQFKQDVQTYTSALDTITKLHPVTFRYKTDTTREHIGLIAEEVNQIEPRLTQFQSDGTIRGVYYDELAAVLTKAIQELDAKILSFMSSLADLVKTKEVQTDKLCVGQTCVTETELKALLQTHNESPLSTPTITTPATTPALTATSTPTSTSMPESTPTATTTPETAPAPVDIGSLQNMGVTASTTAPEPPTDSASSTASGG